MDEIRDNYMFLVLCFERSILKPQAKKNWKYVLNLQASWNLKEKSGYVSTRTPV